MREKSETAFTVFLVVFLLAVVAINFFSSSGPTGAQIGGFCGDQVCGGSENNINCPLDCGGSSQLITSPVSISIDSPQNNTKVNDSVAIKATASTSTSGASITRVDFTDVEDGKTTADFSSPFSTTWGAVHQGSAAEGGARTLRATATDSSSKQSFAQIRVIFQNLPDTPSGLSAQPADTNITISWTAPNYYGNTNSIQCYKVYRATASGGPYDLITDSENICGANDPGLSASSFKNPWLQPNTKYFYVLKTKTSVGMSPYSAETSATTKNFPSAPQNLKANITSADHQVNLTWQAPSDDGGSAIKCYKVFRSTIQGPDSDYVLITDPEGACGLNDPAAAKYVDKFAMDTRFYYYKIKARNGVGLGDFSNEVGLIPKDSAPPVKVSGLSAAAGNSMAMLMWGANAEIDLDKYFVYQDAVKIASLPKSSTAYNSTGLTNNQPYGFQISAVDIFGNEGLKSDLASAVPFSDGVSDTTLPRILSTGPEDLSEDVERKINITISFSEAMNKLKTEAAVSIEPAVKLVKFWDGNVLSISATLAYGTGYTITIGSGAEDLSGNKIGQSYSFSFTSLPMPTTTTTSSSTTTTTLAGVTTTLPRATTTTVPITLPSRNATEAEALEAIQEANKAISDSRETKNITEAFSFYKEATEAYNKGNYSLARELAERAKISIKEFLPDTEVSPSILVAGALAVLAAIAGAIYYFAKIKKQPAAEAKPPTQRLRSS